MTSSFYFSTSPPSTTLPPEPTRRPPFEVTLRPTRSTRATLKPKNVFNDDSFKNPDFVNPEYDDSRAAGSDESDYYHYYDYEEDYSTTVEPSLGPDLKFPRPQMTSPPKLGQSIPKMTVHFRVKDSLL